MCFSEYSSELQKSRFVKETNAFNFRTQAKLSGIVTAYNTIDSFMNQDEAMNYAVEYLNSLVSAGKPQNCLSLKVNP